MITEASRAGSMDRVFVDALGALRVRRDEIPRPAPWQVVVKTKLVGICGSDTHARAGLHPFLPRPYDPGHEAYGVIHDPGNSTYEAGERVVLKPNVVCGACRNCLAGRSNACLELRWIGCDPEDHWRGAMADYFVAPARNVYPVGAGITDRQASLVECLATPIHAVRLAHDVVDAACVVVGAGTIGILTLLAARRAGAGKIIVVELDAAKRERSLRLGADAAVDGADDDLGALVRENLGGRAHVVFDCVASERSASAWAAYAERGATICVVGVPERPFTVPMPQVQDWELRVQGCAGYTESDFMFAMQAAGDIPANELVSHVFAPRDAETAFDLAANPVTGKVLVAFDPTLDIGSGALADVSNR